MAVTTYFISKPRKANKKWKGSRKGFVISRKVPQDDGSHKVTKVNLEPLDAINAKFLDKTLTFDQAFQEVKRLVAQLRRKRDVEAGREKVIFPQNQKILENYWQKIYGYSQDEEGNWVGGHRKLVDPASMRYDLERAVFAIGNLPLTSASANEMQQALGKLAPNKQRRAVSRLNQILKFIGRDFQLWKEREEVNEVRFISISHFTERTCAITEDHPLWHFLILSWVAVSTGLRLGEIFALEPHHLVGRTIKIAGQRDEKFILRKTKNRKDRRTLVLKEGQGWLSKWFAIPDAVKRELRLVCHSRLIGTLLDRKDLCFHDLRHSYAIHLISHGASMTMVAQSLGNSVKVCEQHYVGHMLQDESIEMLARLMDG